MYKPYRKQQEKELDEISDNIVSICKLQLVFCLILWVVFLPDLFYEILRNILPAV